MSEENETKAPAEEKAAEQDKPHKKQECTIYSSDSPIVSALS